MYNSLNINTNYYPFGSLMPGRHTVQTSSDYDANGNKIYRYGFNGKESDFEAKNSGGTQYDYGFRIYDPRIAKFLSVDPLSKSYPMLTPYQYAANGPIWATDLDGLEANLAISGQGNGNKSELNTFNARAVKVASTAKNHTTIHQIFTGADFVDLLKTKSNSEGSIASFVIFSHGMQGGVPLTSNNGFFKDDFKYGNGANARRIEDVVSGINNNEIRFEDNAIALFNGCNCGGWDGPSDVENFAKDFANQTGVTTIAAVGNVAPEIKDGKETGNFSADVGFYKYEKQEDGSVSSTFLGKTINSSEFQPDITIEKVQPKTITNVSEPEN